RCRRKSRFQPYGIARPRSWPRAGDHGTPSAGGESACPPSPADKAPGLRRGAPRSGNGSGSDSCPRGTSLRIGGKEGPERGGHFVRCFPRGEMTSLWHSDNGEVLDQLVKAVELDRKQRRIFH